MRRFLACSVALLAGCTAGNVGLDAGGADVPVIPAEGGPQCALDHECDDRVACTIDLCTDGACETRPCADCCDEGLECVPGFGCRTAPTPCTTDEECVDEVRCTLDYCRDATSCVHEPEVGLCDEGEICLPAVGCIAEPPTSCSTAADCEIGVVCVGEWSCDPEFGCQFVSLRDCDDADACTVDACSEEAGGCTHTPRDVDDDGYGDDACGGDDCDDGDPDVNPGATEVCGGVDEDCDGVSDPSCCESDLPCTASCGSAGRTVCEDDTMRCAPPAEICNGADDDCDGMVDDAGDGFECVLGASESCATSCGSGGSRTCGSVCTWSDCATPAETCNGDDDDCDGTADNGFDCSAGEVGACGTTCGSTGSRACLGSCSWDTCIPPAETCNGVDDNCNASADEGFACVRNATTPCSALAGQGYFAGTAVCASDCSGWNTSACTRCGDGNIDAPEQCDISDLGGNDCTTIGMGFGGGTLACASNCQWNTSGCSRCGNGVIDSGEQCDGTNIGTASCMSIGGGFNGGTLRCGSSCAYDTSMCTVWNPSGTYTPSPRPTFSCTWHGLPAVSFNIGSFTFIDNGSTLEVGGAPCGGTRRMTGGSARNASRSFDVTCTYDGTCAETYRLTGMFTGDDTWTATFSAHYLGDCDTCDNPPNPRTWSVTGTR